MFDSHNEVNQLHRKTLGRHHLLLFIILFIEQSLYRDIQLLLGLVMDQEPGQNQILFILIFNAQKIDVSDHPLKKSRRQIIKHRLEPFDHPFVVLDELTGKIQRL